MTRPVVKILFGNWRLVHIIKKIQYEKLKGSYDAFFKDHSFLFLV